MTCKKVTATTEHQSLTAVEEMGNPFLEKSNDLLDNMDISAGDTHCKR